MATTTTYPATSRQLTFIDALIRERMLDGHTRFDIVKEVRSGITTKRASDIITFLLSKPKGAGAATTSPANTAVQEALALIPKSKYAIPANDIDAVLEKTPVTGDMLFIEVREYMKRLYMRRLTGSVGGFSRWQVATNDAISIAKLVATDPYKYTKLFGEHYSCCGSCGAELTDTRSRELQLGPECRKKFGFKK